jgi:hypothetical protein
MDENSQVGQHLFDSMLLRAGYSEEERDAIRRGMTIGSFTGQMPTDKKQYRKIIASWLEQGGMQ